MNHVYAVQLQIKKMLRNLDHCLDKAIAYAQTKKFDPSVLLHARFAPDMFSLTRQVQAACDQAKFAAARTAGKEAPSHPDNEQSIPELKQRIATVLAYLDTFTEHDFEGSDKRNVALPRWEGKSLTATHYLLEQAMPNFFFHVTMAYGLLRHSGVDVGKRDYLGPMTWN